MPIASEVRRPSVLPPRKPLLDTSQVFYAPLWHPACSLSPFNSMNPGTVISCTNHGATWTLQSNGLYVPYFEGSDDYIDLGTVAPLFLTTQSVLAWVKRGDLARGQHIVGAALNGCGFYFDFTALSNKLGVGKVGRSEVLSTGSVADTTTWHQVGFTYDGTTVNFFIDGVPAGGPAYADPTFANVQKAIGVRPDIPGTTYLKGYIDEVRIDNRVLSMTEVLQFYINTKWRHEV